MKNLTFLSILFIGLYLLGGCKKEDSVDSCFTYVRQGLTVDFNSECSQGSGAFDWEFGNLGTSIDPNPSFTFPSSGSYQVTLRVTDNGESSTSSQTISVDESTYDDSPDNNNDFSSCSFLREGNQWKYLVVGGSVSDTFTYEIIKETNGVFEVLQGLGSTNVNISFYWFTEGSYLNRFSDNQSKNDAQRIFKCGASVGDTWTEVYTLNTNETITYKVVDVNATYTSNGMTFNNCIKIEQSISNPPSTTFSYWHPTYGPLSLSEELTIVEKNF